MLAAVVSIPYLLNHLGNGGFGVLALIWALIGYFSLFDMGIGRALTYQVGMLLAAGNRWETSSVVRTGLLLSAATGALGAGVMYLISPTLVGQWIGVDSALKPDSILAFRTTAIGVMLVTVSSAMRGALEGYGRFASSNLNKMASGLFTFVLPVVSVALHGSSLRAISTYLVVARLVTTIGMLIQLRGDLLSKAFKLSGAHFRGLLGYGTWVTVSGIIGPLMVYGDRFFVSATIGTSQLPYYAIPQEGLQRLLVIPAALCSALLPALSGLRKADAFNLFQINLRRITKYALLVCAIAALLSYPVLYFLFSREFAQIATPIALILCIGILLNSVAFVPYTFLHSQGLPRLTAFMHGFELIFYIGILWLLTRQFGLIGAAAAWVARVGLDLLLLSIAVNWLRKREE